MSSMTRRGCRIGSRPLRTFPVEELNLSNLQAQWQASIGRDRMQARSLTIFPPEAENASATAKVDLPEPRGMDLWVEILRWVQVMQVHR